VKQHRGEKVRRHDTFFSSLRERLATFCAMRMVQHSMYCSSEPIHICSQMNENCE
jgi:hypothetical protein